MFNKKISKFFALLLCFFAIVFNFSMPVLAQNAQTKVENTLLEKMTAELNREFIAGSISASEAAEAALSKVDQVQSVLQNFIHDKELQCQNNFFVTACFDDLRQTRRQVQDVVRRVSSEAKSFLRKARAAKFESKSETSNTKLGILEEK
jgi:hypothetical protein